MLRRWLWALAALSCTRPAGDGRTPLEEPLPATGAVAATPPLPSAARPTTAAWSNGDAPQESLARDTGIFGELNERLKPGLAPWLTTGPLDVWREREGAPGWVLAAGVPVARATSAQKTTVRGASLTGYDTDRDGIPDAFDVLLGALKVELNSAEYRSNYVGLPYPNGDVPRTEGVCSDVVVRALRNAGIDLQSEIQDDAATTPGRYPGIEKRDKNIDHRRVKNLLPWFVQHWTSLGTQIGASSEPWLPGDIVFFDTLTAAGPDHLGILADRNGESGLPLVINNWTDGYRESAMDLLARVPITHHFRVPRARLPAADADAGLLGLMARHRLTLPPATNQVLLVVAGLWSQNAARLYRFERGQGSGEFALRGRPFEVRLGANGLGVGLGLHPKEGLTLQLTKREGDRRSPAGMFSLGTAFGTSKGPPHAEVRWPWRQTTKGDVFVDDPQSKAYNTWQLETPEHDWKSREDLTQYELGIVVEHNRAQLAGAGSAIFIHSLASSRPTTGCTGLATSDLIELLRWLRPEQHPVLVQLAGTLHGDDFAPR